ncbi:hypothetical protein L207DRAFT_510111 [Hyaloscypha variabilis F]|uniref:Uncharacterized protein n=1 Tax=Hyaloscypha variabilis (strain UAMH 11265 / GT02V1 / F) TaxID=1149755 RepID=A0A2J6RYL4_HYAVF|nr:hypothetical protein L207DRAFT_510111 [Hyaloscypha variabilis F]
MHQLLSHSPTPISSHPQLILMCSPRRINPKQLIPSEADQEPPRRAPISPPGVKFM